MRPISFRWSDEFVAAIDEARGDVSRSRWVRRAVEQALGSSGRAGVRGRVPALPPAEQPPVVKRVEVPWQGTMTRVRSSAEARPFRPVPKKGA